MCSRAGCLQRHTLCSLVDPKSAFSNLSFPPAVYSQALYLQYKLSVKTRTMQKVASMEAAAAAALRAAHLERMARVGVGGPEMACEC